MSLAPKTPDPDTAGKAAGPAILKWLKPDPYALVLLSVVAFPSIVDWGQTVHEGLDPTGLPSDSDDCDRATVIAVVVDAEVGILE